MAAGPTTPMEMTTAIPDLDQIPDIPAIMAVKKKKVHKQILHHPELEELAASGTLGTRVS